MSDRLDSQRGERKHRKSTSADWREVLELGKKLLVINHAVDSFSTNISGFETHPDQSPILAQRDLIIATANALSGGQSELWLPSWLGFELGYSTQKRLEPDKASELLIDLFSEEPGSPTARRAVSTRRACTNRSRKSTAILAIPLLSSASTDEAAEVLGALTIWRLLGPSFRLQDQELFKALAAQIAMALQSSRHQAVERRRIVHLTTLSEVGNAITSVLNEEDFLQQVVNLIHDRFYFPFVHLFSVHPGRRKIFFESGSGSRSAVLAEAHLAFDLDDPSGLIPWAARHGETILVNDISQDNRYRPSSNFSAVTQSELTIPVKFGSEILGVLDIQSDELNAFTPDEMALCEALANTIAIAMRNASLYRSERWRRQVADSLREVAGLVSADVGLDQILEATLIELERNLPCDLSAVWFLDDEHSESRPQESLPGLRLAALQGAPAAWLEAQIGLSLEEMMELNRSPQDDPAENVIESETQPFWLLEALEADTPVTRAGDALPDSFGRALDFPDNYSAVAAALRVGDKCLGLLTLLNRTPGRYGGEARAMTATFASYASVAIQNTRLYESAHEQVWVSTVLLQVADATQSIEDLNELLSTVVSITPMLVGVKACAVYLANQEGLFFPAAVSGIQPESQAEFERSRFNVRDLPALEHLWHERRPTILNRQGEDLRLAALFPPGVARGEIFDLLVLVPLLAHTEILGALLVQYSSDSSKNALQALENFFDEHLAIIQGIAHQAATAVENIRLLKSQKEEAYVSIALLQVAQAIVSSSDLHETLGSIVRITPILTGVKRVAIYLFEQKTAQLRLAQSYGLPRDANTYPYSLDEFPILEAALQHDALIAYPLNPVQDDEWEDVPETWTYLPAPDLDEVDEYLTGEERLLIVFPLAVKGDVLGAMLIEEPDLSGSQDQANAISNLRLRSKRLEIVTGISQQSALAVQNDLLQRETVKRERLEREMQLARDIQRAFLPSQTPAWPGWEINVWWRTAREMGGDFYDFIDFPNGCIGLVIADVADKGMPAAMFMILTRALLRASVRENSSPAEVLSQVNNLLLPDAHEGMFVTLFYAVCNPQTGQFTYANAGHNPPVWARQQSNTIELLSRSGMALGVLENSPFEERSLTLEPGDLLVLYTDGVTEANAPDGTLFGNDRLYQAIWDRLFSQPRQNASAQAMLQTLDQTLEAFTGSAPPADDSTVLILYRQPDPISKDAP